MTKTYRHLFSQLISKENLELAYCKARRGKQHRPDVREFHEHWRYNLAILHHDLKYNTYQPRPLKQYILRDPKTRLISVSSFRDRIVHHALINILQPIYEPRFIHDSYASRKNKGTSKALLQIKSFLKKATKNGRLRTTAQNNNTIIGYALKCDIKHYFDTVDHKQLIAIMRRYIDDERVLNLVQQILNNYPKKEEGKGMPLGNWTSQFFANIYLHELDYFVKYELRAKYYLRYVDDFIILHTSRKNLESYKQQIEKFLLEKLLLTLHLQKSRIIPLSRGVPLLGMRMHYHYTLLAKKNLRSCKNRFAMKIKDFHYGTTSIESINLSMCGWQGYAMHANTHKLRERIMRELVNELLVRNKMRSEKRTLIM